MKLAIIGTGAIIPVTLDAIKEIDNITVTSIYAREHSLERGKELAIQYSIPMVYTDYEKLLQTDECDTVYIANVNSVHFDYAKKALQAGKHVILEKPCCAHSWQVRELMHLAQKKHLFVFEAVTNLHMPNFHHIKEDIKKIGNIKLIQANYSQYSSRYNAYKKGEVQPAFNPVLYGGALHDINIYNLNLVVALFGEPLAVQYNANIGFNGVDTSGTVQLKYEDFYAHCTGAKDSESPSHFTIQGDLGYIEAHGPTGKLNDYTFYHYETKKETHHRYNKYEHHMVHEFLEFEEMLRTNDYASMKKGLHTSIRVMEIVELSAQSAGITYGE